MNLRNAVLCLLHFKVKAVAIWIFADDGGISPNSRDCLTPLTNVFTYLRSTAVI